MTSKSELCIRIPWSSLNRTQVSGAHPRSTSDSWVLGLQGSVTVRKDPSLGTSHSSSDLYMGSGLMTGNWKDCRLVGGFLDFTVVYLITEDGRIDDKLWGNLLVLHVT